MFIRPMGVTVRAANRPAGSPLLRGLLARASGAAQETAGAVRPEEPPLRGLPAREIQTAEAEPLEEPEPDPMDEPEPDYEPEPVDAVYWESHPVPTPTAPPGLAAELRQLADLAREGLLTPQEFTAAKTRLLNG
ncbi:SHOCT domain-containing protein [Streptomyces sp. NPDC058892]|uniref:SHOCT domain-containing protein n=1 Tax=unclassified Streptomyces TaxID=2593676 RepID=UPI003677926F